MKKQYKSIDERIQYLVNTCSGKSYIDFARKIHVCSRSVSNWSKAKSQPNEGHLISIESTFNVNPQWLREGVGEMFLPEVPNGSTKEIEAIVEILEGLPAEKQRVIIDDIKARVSLYSYIENLVKENCKKEND